MCTSSLLSAGRAASHRLLVAAGALLLAALPGPHAAAQGLLTPPPGAPAPTQKSLAEIGARLDALESATAGWDAELTAQRYRQGQLLQLIMGEQLPWLDHELHPGGPTPVLTPPLPRNYRCAVAAGPDDRRHAAWTSDGTVRYACADGAGWSAPEVVGAGDGVALALLPDGRPIVALAAVNGDGTRVVRRSAAGGWEAQPVWSKPAQHLDLVVHPGGTAWLVGGDALRLFLWDLSTPEPVGLEFGPANGFAGMSAALGPDGWPAVAVVAGTRAGYFRYDGAAWSEETILSGQWPLLRVALAFSPLGQPAVVVTADRAHLREIAALHRTTAGWVRFPGSIGWMATEVDLAFGPDGQPWLAIGTPTQRLLRNDGTEWLVQRAWDPGMRGVPSVAVGPGGDPFMGFLDVTAGPVVSHRRVALTGF